MCSIALASTDRPLRRVMLWRVMSKRVDRELDPFLEPRHAADQHEDLLPELLQLLERLVEIGHRLTASARA